MSEQVTFRTFKQGDYEMCCDWWRWWWKEIPVKRKVLPNDERCFVIENNNIPVAAVFLYAAVNPEVGYQTWLVSNPEYRRKDRRKMLELLVANVAKEAKETWGMSMLFTVCVNKHMENIHENQGWFIERSAPCYEAFKYL